MTRPGPLSGLFLPSHRRAARRRPPRPTTRAAAYERLEDRTLLTAFVVNSEADGPPAADGLLTLREALTAANTNAASGDAASGDFDGDTITFAAGRFYPIRLTEGELVVADDVRIGGEGRVTVDAALLSRVLTIGTAHSVGGRFVTLSGLTVTGGWVAPGAPSDATFGGGIFIESGETVTLSDIAVVGNTAVSGGGIYNRGTLVVDACLIARNRATFTGGGIYNNGGLYVHGSTVRNNSADGINPLIPSGFGGGGGGIHSAAYGPAAPGPALTIRRSVIDSNSSGGSGGGVSVLGRGVLLDQSTVSNNSAQRLGDGKGGYGGGLYVEGYHPSAGPSATIHNSVVRGNSSYAFGGGISLYGGSASVYGGVVEGNRSSFGGGGVVVLYARLLLDSSRLVGNSAGSWNPYDERAFLFLANGGGLYVYGAPSAAAAAVVHRSEVRDNTASLRGGGLWINEDSVLTVDQSYVRGNRTQGTSDADGGGGLFNEGGGVLVAASVVDRNAAVGQTGGPSRSVPTSGSGGGIASSGGEVVVYASKLSENFAFRAGGGASVLGGRFVADRSVFEANTAGTAGVPGLGYGGGLSAGGADAFVYLYFSEVRNNGAFLAGGGLRNQAGGTLIVDRSVLVGNVARGGEGGGGVFNAGTLAVLLSYVTDNGAEPSAELSGGGLYQVAGGTARLERSVVTRNRAGRLGGGVFTEAVAVTDVDALESVFANLPDDFNGPGSVV